VQGLEKDIVDLNFEKQKILQRLNDKDKQIQEELEAAEEKH